MLTRLWIHSKLLNYTLKSGYNGKFMCIFMYFNVYFTTIKTQGLNLYSATITWRHKHRKDSWPSNHPLMNMGNHKARFPASAYKSGLILLQIDTRVIFSQINKNITYGFISIRNKLWIWHLKWTNMMGVGGIYSN